MTHNDEQKALRLAMIGLMDVTNALERLGKDHKLYTHLREIEDLYIKFFKVDGVLTIEMRMAELSKG